MAFEEYTPEQQQALAYGMEYYQPDNTAIADALRQFTPPNAQDPNFVGLDQKERLQKLLEQKQMTQQPQYQRGGGQAQMPNMNMMQGMMGGSGFAPSGAAATPGTGSMDFGAGFGTTGNSVVNAGASSAPMGAGDFAGSSAAGSSGGGLMDFGSSFGSTGSSTVAPGTAATGAQGGGWASNLGMGGGTNLSYASAVGGGLSGYLQGRQNYQDDPNMWNGKDGYGKYHKDYRAEVGGGTLGGVMGYFGGPIGAAAAGPAVKYAHKFMEPATRKVINFGDKVGGAGGALALDPAGTISSGKYSWGDIGKGALLGPAQKWLGW